MPASVHDRPLMTRDTHNPCSRVLAPLAHGIGTMVPVMDIRELQDEALVAQARHWRLRALRGEKDARGLAHELECEVRRRFPRNEAPRALPRMPLLGALPPTAQRRWKPW